MTPQLIQFLETLREKETVGSIKLGTGRQTRHIFLSGKEAHLLEAGRECRFVPSPLILKNPRLSPAILQETMQAIRKQPQGALKLLYPLGILTSSERKQLQRYELLEEMLSVFETRDSFSFEEGAVPAELLLPANSTPGIHFEHLLDCVRVRLREGDQITRGLPTGTEIPVITDKGKEAVAGGLHWTFMEIARLIDGDRSLDDVVRDSIFFPHLSRQILVSGLLQGWIRKTVFRDLLDLDPATLTPQAARELIGQFHSAIEVAFDELPLRRKRAGIYLRGGLVEEAIQEFVAVGHLLRARHDLFGAVQQYKEALRWDHECQDARDALHSLFLEAADLAHQANQPNEELSFVYEALHLRRGDLDMYLRAAEVSRGNQSRIAALLPALLDRVTEDGGVDFALAFLEKLREKYPHAHAIRAREIDLLVDNGRNAEAAQRLENLANDLTAVGRIDEAARVYRKVVLLAPERRKEFERLDRRARRPRRSRSRIAFHPGTWIAITLLALVALMHLWSYQGYSTLIRKADALAAAPVPPFGTHEFVKFRQDAERLAGELRDYGESHAFTLFGRMSEGKSSKVQGVLDSLNRTLGDQLEALAKRAQAFEDKDDFASAIPIYEQLAELGTGTDWEGRASRRVKELTEYERMAAQLLAAGNEAYKQGRYADSFAQLREIVHLYPRSSSARQTTLPIQVVTNPAGALVKESGRLLGTSPLLLRINPAKTLRLEVSALGYKTRYLRIEDPTSPEIKIHLSRE